MFRVGCTVHFNNNNNNNNNNNVDLQNVKTTRNGGEKLLKLD